MQLTAILLNILLSTPFAYSAPDSPFYTTDSIEAIIGEYQQLGRDNWCPDGHTACDSADVIFEDGQMKLILGKAYRSYNEYLFEFINTKRGVLVFSNDKFNDDCQDPGCADILSASGVVYPVKEGKNWLPQIKINYIFECRFPDEPDACDGEVNKTLRFRKVL